MNECPICNSTMEDIHVFDSVPLSSAQLFNEFTTIEQTPMDLSICCNCNHVSNFNYQPSIYTNDNYVTKIASSTSMSANLQKIINFLNTTNKNVLEIGSGSGEIANYFSNNNNVTTVDPCVSEYENKNITHHKTFFDDNYPNIKYDLIIARHILEHTNNPIQFLKLCKSKLNEDGMIYIEIPNLESTISENRIIDFFNDHIQHFSNNSIDLCSRLAGLRIDKQIELLNNAHIGLLLKPVQDISLKIKIGNSKTKYEELLLLLNKPFVIYGAGAHASTFIGSIPENIKENIIAILDNDSNKTGKFLPGLKIPISKPSTITTDIVVNTSILYKQEIENFLKNNLYYNGTIIHL